MEWKCTRVWKINNQIVVAKTIEQAIALYKEYRGNRGGRPGVLINNIIGVCSEGDYDAIIEVEEQKDE